MSMVLQFTKENGVGTLQFNRPDKFNSFNQELAFAVQKALDACQADDEIRVIVLTGSGKAFCAGQDLVEATDPNGPPLKNIVGEHYNPIIRKIREIEKPIIAAVNGVAAGAGANIALACDIVVAADTASFIQAFSAIGLIPDSGGTFFLPRLIGFQKASALAMLGDKVSATEAEQMGMIYKCFPAADFDEAVEKLSNKVANMPTRGLVLTKLAFNQSFNNDLDTQLDLESKLQILASETDDYHEGVAAFVEKRQANFKGK